ncbi:MAG: 4'-phosphopantetheinyl transferase superfamily protein [Polaromonas sp.]|nr:4'-phosphopantetheinyl transferase superfamily protein [Polaromonas sp.]
MGPWSPVSLKPVEVRLWLIDSSRATVGELQACEQSLSPDEQQRAGRFISSEARRQFVLARALLRRALSCCTGVPPAQWVFAQDPYGKPHVAEPAGVPLSFNVSHTRGLAACAVTDGGAVGVDVEHRGRTLDLPGLARQLFAAREMEHFESLEPQGARDYFFAIWTLKEAYLKARGVGLSHPLEAVSLELAGANGARCSDTDQPWHFLRSQPTRAHVLALCTALPQSPHVTTAWVSAVELSK